MKEDGDRRVDSLPTLSVRHLYRIQDLLLSFSPL